MGALSLSTLAHVDVGSFNVKIIPNNVMVFVIQMCLENG